MKPDTGYFWYYRPSIMAPFTLNHNIIQTDIPVTEADSDVKVKVNFPRNIGLKVNCAKSNIENHLKILSSRFIS